MEISNNISHKNINNTTETGFWERTKNYAKSLFSGWFGDASATSSQNTQSREIPMVSDISDEQIQTNNTRSKYIRTVQNPPYTIKAGDNLAKIAGKFGVQYAEILALNGLDENSAKKIRAGKVIKLPPTRTPQNINSLADVAKAMGVSQNFVLRLKRLEDGKNKKDNEFWNYTYDDATGKKSDGKNVKGTETIGIGHVWKKGEPRNLNNKQILELCVKDMLKMEDHLRILMGGQKNYDKLPQAIKEALLDMTFNKGTDIIKNSEGLLWCLKNGKYEAAINKMTNNKSAKTGKEMSGLSKRRLFDIETASRMYKGNVPQSIRNTAQQVYNRGVELLRKEYPRKSDFEAMLAGFNNDSKKYTDLKIKLITK